MVPVRLAVVPPALLLGVLGVGLAAALTPAAGVAALAVTGMGAGWAWERADGAWPTWMWPSAVVVPFAVLGATGWLAAGAPGAVAAAGAVTSVVVLRSRRVHGGRAGTRSCPVSAPPLPPAVVDPRVQASLAGRQDMARWTDADLCRIWCQTYAQVVATARPATLSTLVACRNAVLDELERRNPVGFAAWIDSGARAAGSPEPYLQS